MSSVKHIMFLSKNVKTPLLLEVKVGFVYGLKGPIWAFFYCGMKLANADIARENKNNNTNGM